MKKLLFTIIISCISLSAAFAADDLAISGITTDYAKATSDKSSAALLEKGNTQVATSGTASTTVSTSTPTSTVNDEVDSNYSEIIGLKDCSLLKKRVNQRVVKIVDRLDKQSKSVDTLIFQIDNIVGSLSTSSDTKSVEATDTSALVHDANAIDAATNTNVFNQNALSLQDLVSNLKDKMYLLSTTTSKYVKGLKSIESNKCETNQKLVKSQILASKPIYKDLLVADYDLKNYIKVDIKNALVTLRDNASTTSEAYSPDSKTAVGFWESVKAVFK